MTTKKVSTPRAGNRKPADNSDEALARHDAPTHMIVRAIMDDPKTRASVKARVWRLVNDLNEWANDSSLPSDDPDITSVMCRDALQAFRVLSKSHRLYGEALEAFGELTRYAAEHEPEEHRLARRCVEIYNAEIARHEASPTREHYDGAHFFLDRGVDPVMTNSSDNIMVNDPNHELFVLLFVRAAREYRGAEAPNAYTHLLDIIRRFDAGESLEAMHDE